MPPSPPARRVIAKLVLFLAGVWVLFLAKGSTEPFDPIRLPLYLIPGCAFVPAAWYAIRLHRHDHSTRSWNLLVVYAVAGVVLMIASGAGLNPSMNTSTR
jgi:hypothetical protein